jgi:small subunit ribosomal protein S18
MIMNPTKQCYFSQNNIQHIDYKDTEILKKFLNPHARMISKKRSGVTSKNQRKLALAVKRARFMALLPFVAR